MNNADLRIALENRLEGLLDTYYSGWRKRGNIARPLPSSKTDDGSMYVYLNGSRRGGWFRPSCKTGGDPVALIAYSLSGHTSVKCTRPVFEEAKAFLGWTDSQPIKKERRIVQKQDNEDSKVDIPKMLKQCRPLKDSIGEKYFNSRGIFLKEWPRTIHFHPNLYHSPGLFFPAIISIVVDRKGNPTGILRTYLKKDGTGKAEIDSPKKMLGSIAGGCVRLGECEYSELAVCEGIETGLSISYLSTIHSNTQPRPVFALLSTSNTNWLPPEGINSVRIYADGDLIRKDSNGNIQPPPGKKFAEALKANLIKNGFNASIQPAPRGGDWNDVLRKIHK